MINGNGNGNGIGICNGNRHGNGRGTGNGNGIGNCNCYNNTTGNRIGVNNNGIGAFNPTEYTAQSGEALGDSTSDRLKYPVKSLTPQAHYEGFATALGAKGVYVDTADALESAVKEAMSVRPFKFTLINCMISTTASRGKAAAPPFAAVGKL